MLRVIMLRMKDVPVLMFAKYLLIHFLLNMKHGASQLYLGASIQACREPLNHSGAPETIIVGPCHNLIPYAPKMRKRGEGCPLTIPLGVWGSVVSFPSGDQDGAPVENGFMHI